MDDMRLLIALAALLLGVWNFLRLKELDEKKEYKDKHILYRECSDECSALLERITIETEELIVRSSYLDLLDSPYIGSYGFQQAHEAYIKNLREIQSCKAIVTSMYADIQKLVSLPDKDSFDGCIAKQKELKDIFLNYINSYAGAKSQLDGIEKMAIYQRENA